MKAPMPMLNRIFSAPDNHHHDQGQDHAQRNPVCPGEQGRRRVGDDDPFLGGLGGQVLIHAAALDFRSAVGIADRAAEEPPAAEQEVTGEGHHHIGDQVVPVDLPLQAA